MTNNTICILFPISSFYFLKKYSVKSWLILFSISIMSVGEYLCHIKFH